MDQGDFQLGSAARSRAVRRHTGRVATRFAVLLTGDVIAIFIARVIALWLAADTVWGAEMFSQTPLHPMRPGCALGIPKLVKIRDLRANALLSRS